MFEIKFKTYFVYKSYPYTENMLVVPIKNYH